MLSGMVDEGIKASNAANLKLEAATLTLGEKPNTIAERLLKPKPEGHNVLKGDITIRKMEKGTRSNFSLTSRSGCRSHGFTGSVGCYFRFGKTDTYNTSLHLISDFEPGSSLVISMRPKVAGFLGRMVNAAIERRLEVEDAELPLCGDPSIVNWMGKPIMYKPIPCGPYAVNAVLPLKEMSMPAADKVPLKRILNFLSHGLPFNIPSIGVDVNMLPGMSIIGRVQMRHVDGSTILDADFKVMLDRSN